MSTTIAHIEKKKMPAPNLRFKDYNKGWEKKKLEEVVKIGRGKSKHRPRNDSFLYGGKYPFVQTGDIKAADLYLTEYTQTYSEEGLKQSKLWDENTLCVTIAANIAETAILKIKACFPDSIIGLIPKENQTTVLFVKHLFDKFKIEIQNLSQGIAQDNLNQEKLSKIEFGFPTLPEQQKIASFLSAVDEKIQQLTRKKELLEEYKKGVMQQIFTGKLRFKDENGKAFPKWENEKLENVLSIKKGEQLNASELTETGLFPALNGGINPSGYTDKWNMGENVVTVSEGGNSCGYVNLAKTKFWCGGHCYALIELHKIILNDYLFHFLKYNELKIMRLRVGSGLPNIQKKDLNKFKIDLPSVEEQKKIANYLSNIDKKIESVNKQITQTQTFKKGLLQQMFV